MVVPKTFEPEPAAQASFISTATSQSQDPPEPAKPAGRWRSVLLVVTCLLCFALGGVITLASVVLYLGGDGGGGSVLERLRIKDSWPVLACSLLHN